MMTKILIIEDEFVRVPRLSSWASKAYLAATISNYDWIPEDIDFSEYDVLMLDHDLGENGDVYDLLRNRDLDGFTGEVIIHSMNPVGAINLSLLFRNADVYRVPYSIILTQRY